MNEVSARAHSPRTPSPLRRRNRRGISVTEAPSPVVDCALYENGTRRHGELPFAHALDAARSCSAGFVWIGLHHPTAAEFEGIAKEFQLHPLAVEDAVHAHQRPKLERYSDVLFLVLKTMRYDDCGGGPEGVTEQGELMIFLGPEFVITVRHGEGSPLHDVRRTLEGRPELLERGPAAVLYAVLDHVVDDYVDVVDALTADVEEAEAALFDETVSNDPRRSYELKRELISFKRSLTPLSGPLHALVDGSIERVPDGIRAYLRDVEDHLQRVREQVLALDELVTGIVDANLTQVSVRQNEDMRKISAWVAILAVPTMIAGVYGMNFDHMPELHWRYGYPFAALLTLTICLVLYRAFRRSGWL